MRKFTIIAVLLIGVGSLRAETYSFSPRRFEEITLDTAHAKERIIFKRFAFKESDKDQMLFASRLTEEAPLRFVSPNGTIFTLTHLPEAIINDGNRHINSGDWQLTISGTSAEAKKVKSIFNKGAFSDNPPGVYLGGMTRSPEEERFNKADAELNKTYQKLQSRLTSSRARTELAKSQRAWIAFRNADSDLRAGILMTVSDEGGDADLTEERTGQLETLLNNLP